jgi:hypothetical protein
MSGTHYHMLRRAERVTARCIRGYTMAVLFDCH